MSVISRNDKLTFGDLAIGDLFIGFPLPGDDSGHGGYKGTHWIYEKTKSGARRKTNKAISSIPNSMLVIKIA